MSFSSFQDTSTGRSWTVAALCRAVADQLDARFNPVTVRGELSGFTRAASGHCYFTLKDEGGQLRCAMFRRAASQLDFEPRDGALVEVTGRLGVYEARGDLQLVAETMRQAGQGALYEQFLRLKAKLQAQGLFDVERKREIPPFVRHVGVVTSLGAAALHDVVTALRRRAPHVRVTVAPALVQGAGAPASLMQALQSLWPLAGQPSEPLQAILLVRGGGSLEDLWAFNDEALAHGVAQSPVPVISGVGHETDFTIADFVADVRAPTPTAAAELVAGSRAQALEQLQVLQHRLERSSHRHTERQAQRLDGLAARLSRPQAVLMQQHRWLDRLGERISNSRSTRALQERHRLRRLQDRLVAGVSGQSRQHVQRVDQLAWRLQALDPHQVLERGYAWLSDEQGLAIASVQQLKVGQAVQATLADGQVPLQVLPKG